MDEFELGLRTSAYVRLAERRKTFVGGQTDILLGIGVLVGVALTLSAWSGERTHSDFFFGMAAMVLIICVPWSAYRGWMRRQLWNQMWEIDLWFQARNLHIRTDGSTSPLKVSQT